MKKILYILPAAAVILAVTYLAVVPDVSRLKKENPKKTSLMKYTEAGHKKSGEKRDIYQTWVPLSKVSPYLVKAVVIAEDDKFYSHEGFDFEAMEEALEKNIKAGRFKAGGSTISQQLAKNLYLTPEKTVLRKLKEIIITWKIERTLSKRRILELYLNVAEWGDGIFGIEAASRHYFNKAALDLTAEEAARLVAVLPNPVKFDPTGEQKFVVKRAAMVYNIMVRRGIVLPDYEEVIKDETGTAVEGTTASETSTTMEGTVVEGTGGGGAG